MMISEVKSSIIFGGFRGLPKINIDVLARAIVNISQLAFVKEVKEAEINPVIIKKEGIVAVDGLINLS
jgi:succinyl-CoA synthetase beta subunit